MRYAGVLSAVMLAFTLFRINFVRILCTLFSAYCTLSTHTVRLMTIYSHEICLPTTLFRTSATQELTTLVNPDDHEWRTCFSDSWFTHRDNNSLPAHRRFSFPSTDNACCICHGPICTMRHLSAVERTCDPIPLGPVTGTRLPWWFSVQLRYFSVSGVGRQWISLWIVQFRPKRYSQLILNEWMNNHKFWWLAMLRTEVHTSGKISRGGGGRPPSFFLKECAFQ